MAVLPLYAAADDWNEYVKRTANPFDPNSPTCNPAEATFYSDCIHGGLMRVVQLERMDCFDVSATDALDAFVWVCDESVTPVRVISTGFKDGKGMRDLVDFQAVAWRPNRVTVTEEAGVVRMTGEGVWWGNRVSLAPVTGGSLATAGTVYLVPQDVRVTYSIDAPRVAFVTAPRVMVRRPQGAQEVVVSQADFVWVEAGVDSGHNVGGGEDGLVLQGVRFNSVWNTGVLGYYQAVNGIRLTGAANCAIQNTRVAQVLTVTGIRLESSSGNLLRRLHVNNGAVGIGIGESHRNVIVESYVTNLTAGVSVWDGSQNNLVVGVTAGNINVTGVSLDEAPGTFLVDVASVSTGQGVKIGRSPGAKVLNLMSIAHSDAQVRDLVLYGSPNAQFFGKLNTKHGCSVDGGVGCTFGGDWDGFLLSSDLAGVFVERIYRDDAENLEDEDGGAPPDLEDWLAFENMMRGWGSGAAEAFPDVVHQGRCTPNSDAGCRIWDWSISASAPTNRNVLQPPSTGDETIAHSWVGSVASDAECSAVFPGSTRNGNVCVTTALLNAHELFGDAKGNDNGLCESGEACLGVRNFGAYQGHGDVVSLRRLLSGAVSPAHILSYAINGR